IALSAAAAFAPALHGQGALITVADPADYVVQPGGADTGPGEARVAIAFDPAVESFSVSIYGSPPNTGAAAAANPGFFINPCQFEQSDLPGADVPVDYEAFDAGGAKIGAGRWLFTLGPDQSKPAVRVQA